MDNEIVVRGRLVGPKTVELEKPLEGAPRDVDVIVRVVPGGASNGEETVFDFLRRTPGGTRSRFEIDQQLRIERDSWGNG